MKRISILALLLSAYFVTAAWAQQPANKPPIGKHLLHRSTDQTPSTPATAISRSLTAQANEDDTTMADTLEMRVHDKSMWTTVFYDTFQGHRLNPKIWRIDTDDSTGGCNFSLMAYNGKNIYVDDGRLRLVASPQWYIQPFGNGDCGDDITQRVARPYVGARIFAKDRIDFSRPGRIRARFKPSAGIGTGVAIWIYSKNLYYGEWSASGEIDIAEEWRKPVDDPTFPLYPQPHIWFGGAYPKNALLWPPEYVIPDPIAFHTVTFAWDASGSFVWQVDGVTQFKVTPTAQLSRSGPHQTLEPVSYDHRSYCILESDLCGPGANYFSMVGDPEIMYQPYQGVYADYVDNTGTLVRKPSPSPYDAPNEFYLIIEHGVGGSPMYDNIADSITIFNAGNSVDLSNTPNGPISDAAAAALGLPPRPAAFFTDPQRLEVEYVEYSVGKNKKDGLYLKNM